jgi:hypothetical protein
MYVRWLHISLPVLVATLAIAEPALGQHIHFDIFLARPAAGTQTVVGAADVDGQAFDDTTRVFEVELGASLTGEFFASDPGVYHPNRSNPESISAYPSSAGGLQPGDMLHLFERDFSVGGIVDDLFYWNGVGAVSFAPAAANFRIEDGDPLGTTAGAGGSFDYHAILFVDSDALPGIYLVSVYGVVDGFDPSDPVYLVMSTGEEFEEAHELAVEWVEATFVVPEPATLWLMAFACGSIVATHRRRRWLADRS